MQLFFTVLHAHVHLYPRERTSLRARIRSLESGIAVFCCVCIRLHYAFIYHRMHVTELESMKIMRAGMENENVKMRRIISVYIQSADLNDPAWEVMEEDDMGTCVNIWFCIWK